MKTSSVSETGQLCCSWYCVLILILSGCHVQPPGGSVIEPSVLGSSVDELNRLQEENAELNKLIIYSHEFEVNLQTDHVASEADEKSKSTYTYRGQLRPQGLRLTESGVDHVRQIASMLREFESHETMPLVVVERSSTSKHWDTQHQYPVHQNIELDQWRRTVVVKVLESLGIEQADEVVIVAPAAPTGLNAIEAASAYQNAITSGQNNVRSGRTGQAGF